MLPESGHVPDDMGRIGPRRSESHLEVHVGPLGVLCGSEFISLHPSEMHSEF